jgi:hypothetical protein
MAQYTRRAGDDNRASPIIDWGAIPNGSLDLLMLKTSYTVSGSGRATV